MALSKTAGGRTARVNVILPTVFVFGAMAVVVCLALLMKPSGGDWAGDLDRDGGTAAVAGIRGGARPAGGAEDGAPAETPGGEKEKVARSGERVLVPGEARCEGVRGRVFDQRGEPLAGARVLAARVRTLHHDLHPRDYRVFETAIGGDGWYAFEKLPSGTYSLAAVAPGRAGAVSQRFVASRREHSKGASNDCDIVVYHSGEIAGCVQDRDGAPVAGAWVVPYEAKALLTQTDAGGAFTLRDLETSSYDLEIVAPGYCPTCADDVYTGTSDLAAVLDRGGTASGVVRHQDRPAAGIAVVPSGRFAERAVTDGEGRFTIGGLSPGRCDLHVAASGLCAPTRTIYLPRGGTAENIVIDLDKTGGISGTVADESSGEPIPGAWLRVQARGSALCALDSARAAGRTDEAGRFELGSLPAGEYLLVIESAGDHAGGYWREGKIISVAAGAVTGGIEVQLARTPPAAVLVQSPSGEKISGAAVTVCPAESSWDRNATKTGLESEGGTYIVSGLKPGAYNVSVARQWFGMGKEVLAFDTEARAPSVKVVLKPGIEVSGSVADIAGKGIPFANIRVDNARAVTECDGSFVLRGVSEGATHASVRAAGYYGTSHGAVELRPGMDDLKFTLTPEAEHFLGGFVRDDMGKPIAGARLSLWQWTNDRTISLSQFTGKDGGFRLNGVLDAAVNFSVSSPEGEYWNDDEEFAIDDGDIEIEIKRSARVSGTVCDSAGAPVPLFHARFEPADEVGDGWSERFEPSHFTDGDSDQRCFVNGIFDLDQVDPGDLIIMIQTPEGVRALSERLTLTPGARLEGVKIEIPETGSLAGRVVDAVTMQPVPDAAIIISTERNDERRRYGYRFASHRNPAATSADDGAFLAANVPAGAYVATAEHPRFMESDYYDVTVRPRTVTGGLTIAVGSGLVIKGRVCLDGAGKPGARIISATRSTGSRGSGNPVRKESAAGHEGLYEIRGLPPGQYSVSAHVDTGPPASDGPFRERSSLSISRTVSLEGVSEAVCDFDLVPGCAIAGKVYVTGEAKSGIEIWFQYRTPQEQSGLFSISGRCSSGDDGSFRIDYLMPGTYSLHASANEGSGAYFSSSTSVEVGTGVTVADLHLGTEGNCEISGVVTCNGEPLSGASVQLSASGVDLQQRTDSNGFYKIDKVASGECSVSCHLSSGSSWSPVYVHASLTLEPGQRVTQDFSFETGSGVVCGVVTNNGEPVEEAWVTARRSGGDPAGAQTVYADTDEAGAYRIEELAPGLYEVVAGEPRDMRQLVEVADFREARVDFAMRSGDARLAGRVRFPEGETEGAARVFIFAPGACGWTAGAAFTAPTLDSGLIAETRIMPPEGKFRFDDLEPQMAEAVAVIIHEDKIAKIARLAVSIAVGGPEIELSLAE